ncbi:hypothetical protein PybrP1_012657 [[Pythium] brassicae (nom. inval.)]|nr:hypothetical protein PybrP1_012657 [[Pythium] brassicae (nom. inval.)]
MATRLCHVCATGAAKYKCPACRSPYCSAACYKTHKQTPCGPQAATPAATTTSSTTIESSSSAHVPPPQKTQEQELEEAGVEPSQLLSAAQLSGLCASPAVLQALENPAIRALLTKVESSSNRTKELQKALLDPTFASFMYETLDAVSSRT